MLDASGQLAVRVTAPPADGAANAAVVRLLGKVLDLPPRDIVLVGGATSRTKTFEIPLTEEALASRLDAARKKR